MINYKDYKLKSGNILRIAQDIHPDSPNTWDNKDIFLVYDHSDFTIRKEEFEPRYIHEFLHNYLRCIKPERENFEDYENYKETLEAYAEYEASDYNNYYIFPVDAYIHSGVHLSLANTKNYPDRKWDVSTTGFVLVKKSYITEYFLQNDKGSNDLPLELAREQAKGLIETWNQYLSGDVWEYQLLKPVTVYSISKEKFNEVVDKKFMSPTLLRTVIEDAFTKKVEEVEISSSLGFYGSDPKENGMLEHINDELDEL